MWNNTCNWPRIRLSIVYIEQVSMLLDRRLVVRESESTMTRERDWTGYGRGPSILRLLVSHLGSRVEGDEKGGGEKKRLVEKKGIPSMVANGWWGNENREGEDRGEKRNAKGMGWEILVGFASMSLYARLLYGHGTYICLTRARGAAKKSDRV